MHARATEAMAVGAAVAVSGSMANALVPAAMSCFGTIVPGVGTLHSSFGAASALQALSHWITPGVAVSAGMAHFLVRSVWP